MLNGHGCCDCRWLSDFSDFSRLRSDAQKDLRCQRRFKRPRKLPQELLCEYWTRKPAVGLRGQGEPEHKGWLPSPHSDVNKSELYKVIATLDKGVILWPEN